MPSRRAVLSGMAAASGTVLAGCSSSRSLPLAHQTDDPILPDDATAVATDWTSRRISPHGAFFQDSTVYESDGGSTLSVFTDLQLVPGVNAFETAWQLAGFTVEQRYRRSTVGRVTDRTASYAPGPPDNDGSLGIGMRSEVDTVDTGQLSRWEVEYHPATDATLAPTFVTHLEGDGALDEDDRVSTPRLTVRTTGGLFRNGEHELTTDLVYRSSQ